MSASAAPHGHGQSRPGRVRRGSGLDEHDYVSALATPEYLDVAGTRASVRADPTERGLVGAGFPIYDNAMAPSGAYETPHAHNSNYRTVPRPSTVNPVFSISRTEQGTSDTDDSYYGGFGEHSHSAATAHEPVRIVRNSANASPTKNGDTRRVPLLWKVGVAVALVLALVALVLGLTASADSAGDRAVTASPTSPGTAQVSATSTQHERDLAELMIHVNLLLATQAELVANASASATVNSARHLASQATQADLVTNVSRLATTQASYAARLANATQLGANQSAHASASRATQDALVANVSRLEAAQAVHLANVSELGSQLGSSVTLLLATQAGLVANVTRLSASATANSALDLASQATQADLVTNVSRLAATQAARLVNVSQLDTTQTHLVANLTRLSVTVAGQAALVAAVTRQAANRTVQDATVANVTRLSSTVASLASTVTALAALVPTSDPTRAPTPGPTFAPTVPGAAPVSRPPTLNPTRHPASVAPTVAPTGPTRGPSRPPTFPPTVVTVGDVIISQLHHPLALCAVGATSGCQVLDAAAEAAIIELNGSVLFSYSVLTTLAGRFPNLRVIRGGLTFVSNGLLDSIGDGFASLQTVTGALTINNGGPGSGSFFPALERVGSIRIYRGRVTSFVDAFPRLVNVGTRLSLTSLQHYLYCTAAYNCVRGPLNVTRAFPALRNVGGSLTLSSTGTGIIDSFTALETAGALTISYTGAVTLGGSFGAVRSLAALSITSNSRLIGLNSSLAAVSRITGTVRISGNNVNFDVSGALPSLGCVGGVSFQTSAVIQVPPRVASLPAC